MDSVAKGEQVEAELTAFIGKRDEQRRREGRERPAEELWQASERVYQAKRWRKQAWAWVRYHEGQARRHTATLEALIGRHRKEAERYAALLGVEPLDETTKCNGHKRGAA